MTASITKPKTLKMKRRMKMIDTRIGNRSDAINLINEMLKFEKYNDLPRYIQDEDLRNGLKALKEAIEKEVI